MLFGIPGAPPPRSRGRRVLNGRGWVNKGPGRYKMRLFTEDEETYRRNQMVVPRRTNEPNPTQPGFATRSLRRVCIPFIPFIHSFIHSLFLPCHVNDAFKFRHVYRWFTFFNHSQIEQDLIGPFRKVLNAGIFHGQSFLFLYRFGLTSSL
jgi:hypothetical protein